MSPMSEYFGDGEPVRRLVVLSWAKYCTLSLPLFAQGGGGGIGTGEGNAGGSPTLN